MLQEVMIIIVSVIFAAFVMWFFMPIAYTVYTSVFQATNPLIPTEDRQTWEMITDLWYNVIRYLGLIVLGAVAYYLWTVAQRKKAEDIL